MLTTKSPEPVVSLAGQAAQSAGSAVNSAQRAANETIDSVAKAAHDIRQDAIAPLLNRAADRVNEMASRSADALRKGSAQARATAQQASDTTLAYVKDEPVKAMLIAAATGAALLALFNLFTRSRNRPAK
ncbi:MAG: hypothetical protein WAU48_04410 [Gammaproteobacteria bacterium]